MRLSLRRDSSRIQHNNLVAESEYFLAAVGDKENRDAVMMVPLTQVGDQRRSCRTVQRSQWLIEQQRAGLRHQSPCQGDALPFASRNLRRSPVAQVIDAEAIEHLAAARSPLRCAQPVETVSHIFLGGQVREERQILLNIPDAPLPGGDVALLVRVVEVFTANGNPSVIGIGQARDAIEHCRFSGARRAKENREAG
jgi:hypothetical protein